MIEVRQTQRFREWLEGLRDRRNRVRINIRLRRLQDGLFGDVKPVGAGVSELRIDAGPGYRVYFVKRGSTVILLLCGGDKKSQSRDIARAQEMAKELDD